MGEKIKITQTDGLTVVDGQNDFMEEGVLPVKGIVGEASEDQVVKNINDLKEKDFGHRATTEDKHDIGHIETTIHPNHCCDGTRGQRYHQKLMMLYIDANERIVKGLDPNLFAYSIATSPQFSKHLKTLRRKKIKRIFLVGWAYDYCVGETAIDYARQGFEVYVIADATRSVDLPPGNAETMYEKLKAYGVKTITMADIE